MKLTPGLAWGWSAVLGLLAHGAAQQVGLEELLRLDRLPVFKSVAKVGSVSSYDRTGGNDDGFSGKYSFVRQVPEGLILADLTGPGAIYRVWTPTPSDDVLEFLFDGETTPRVAVKFRDLFLGKHPAFPRPLVGFGAGGYYCYAPIPFAKSCIVRMRAPKVQFYQINYALYGPETRLTTFHPQRSPAEEALCEQTCALWRATGTDLSRYTAPPGARSQVSAASVLVPPRSSRRVFASKKGGRIVGLRFWPAEAMITKTRGLLLKVSFDGSEPAVLCPLGDFFGYAWGQPAAQSLLVGTTGGTNYCYFPMPFDRSALVEVVSEENAPVELRAEVVHADLPRAANEGKFYAVWRRENPTKLGVPFTFIETQGRGHLVGVVLQAQGFEPGKTLFFEGDDETTIDGELVIRGTGSEDFFNGGWYDVPDRWEKRSSFPLSGCLGYLKPLGRTGAYRLFLGDAYAFRQSLRQTIEHSGEKNNILTDYCSVTYLYSERRPTGELAPPPVKERAVMDPTEVVFPTWWATPLHAWSFDRASLTRKMERLKGEEVRYLSLAATEQDWFGPHFLSPICELPAAGRYAVYLEVVRGPAQALVQLFQNENPVADPVDFYAEEKVKSGRVLLGRLDLCEGRNNLMFKLVGKHEKSTGLGLDLISIVCVREQ
jgi:hypothetical protein